MIIEIPFLYEAQVIPPRARVPRQVWVRDRLPIKIQEYGSEEFPLVARFTDRFANIRNEGVKNIHSDGRRFYKELEGLSAASLETLARHGAKQTPFHDIQILWVCDPTLAAQHGNIAGRVVSDDRQERIARLLNVAQRIAIHDGKVFYACGEPAWKRMPQWRVEAVLVTPEDLARNPGDLIRADRFEERFAGYEAPTKFGDIELLRPDMLKLSLAVPTLRKEVERSVEFMAESIKRSVMSTSRKEFEAFAALRDAWKATPEGEVTEELVEAIRFTIESMPKNDGMRARLQDALNAWRKESLGVDSPEETEDEEAAPAQAPR